MADVSDNPKNNEQKDGAANAAAAITKPATAPKRTRRPKAAENVTESEPAVAAGEMQSKAAEATTKTKAPRRQVKKTDAGLEEQLVFGKYTVNDIEILDPSLVDYILLTQRAYPNSYGRRKSKLYYLAHVNVIERLINKLMRGGTGKKIGGRVIRTEGRLQGKKFKTMHIVESAFAKIAAKTGKNPIQVFVNAIEYAAPIEDTTRVRYGGINYNVAVGITASRRLDIALKNLSLAALTGSFKNRKSISDALADEIILAANKDANSYAIKRKTETERIARSAR